MSSINPVQAVETVPTAMLAVDLQESFQGAIDTVMDNPWIMYSAAAAGSLLVGSIVEGYMSRRITARRESLASQWGDIVEHEQPSRIRRFGRHILSATAFGAVLIGTANTAVWSQSGTEEVVPAHLEVVVDRSGATALDDEAPAQAVSSLLQELLDAEQTDGISTDALVASTSNVSETDLTAAKATRPFGDAPIQQAYDLGVDQIEASRAELIGGQEVPNSAVVVLTNGNTITVDADANVPTFVINVSAEARNADALKRVAEDTGGAYIENNASTDPEAIEDAINTVMEQVQQNSKDSNNKPNWAARIAVGATSMFAGLKYLRMRPQLTTGFSVGKRTRRSSRRNG